MKITITYDVDNAAFEETSDGEHRRIFAKIADQLARDYDQGTVIDVNGNGIGYWEITAGEAELR